MAFDSVEVMVAVGAARLAAAALLLANPAVAAVPLMLVVTAEADRVLSHSSVARHVPDGGFQP